MKAGRVIVGVAGLTAVVIAIFWARKAKAATPTASASGTEQASTTASTSGQTMAEIATEKPAGAQSVIIRWESDIGSTPAPVPASTSAAPATTTAPATTAAPATPASAPVTIIKVPDPTPTPSTPTPTTPAPTTTLAPMKTPKGVEYRPFGK